MIADEDLVQEWQQGSAGALEALVQRYHAPLLAYLARLTGDPHAAEDLAQETFVQLVREAHTYRYPRPFKPWFYTIARHRARNDWHSAYRRHEEVASLVASVDRPSHEPDPAEWLERLEQRQGFYTILAALSFEQRDVLSLRFDQELSVAETAAVLGVPAGTVKSRVFTALRRLRDLLQIAGAAADKQGESAHE